MDFALCGPSSLFRSVILKHNNVQCTVSVPIKHVPINCMLHTKKSFQGGVDLPEPVFHIYMVDRRCHNDLILVATGPKVNNTEKIYVSASGEEAKIIWQWDSLMDNSLIQRRFPVGIRIMMESENKWRLTMPKKMLSGFSDKSPDNLFHTVKVLDSDMDLFREAQEFMRKLTNTQAKVVSNRKQPYLDKRMRNGGKKFCPSICRHNPFQRKAKVTMHSSADYNQHQTSDIQTAEQEQRSTDVIETIRPAQVVDLDSSESSDDLLGVESMSCESNVITIEPSQESTSSCMLRATDDISVPEPIFTIKSQDVPEFPLQTSHMDQEASFHSTSELQTPRGGQQLQTTTLPPSTSQQLPTSRVNQQAQSLTFPLPISQQHQTPATNQQVQSTTLLSPTPQQVQTPPVQVQSATLPSSSFQQLQTSGVKQRVQSATLQQHQTPATNQQMQSATCTLLSPAPRQPQTPAMDN